MKLFDFKFLILLGLTLVVYFMYKEIDMQRERIQQLEDTYKKLIDKDHECNNDEDIVLSLPPPPPPQTQPPSQIKPQSTSQPKTEITQNKIEIHQIKEVNNVSNNNLKLELPSKMLEEKLIQSVNVKVISDTTEEDSESSTSTSMSSMDSNSERKIENQDNKHLEIYSNDNENVDETSISDSLINKKQETEEKEEKQETEKNQEKQETEEKEEKQELLKKTEETKKLSEKSDSLEDILNNLELNNLDIEINNKKAPSPKMDSTNLSKLKLSELQDIAKKENINLDKKVNGSNKKKTKQELIEEIIAIQKKISN